MPRRVSSPGPMDGRKLSKSVTVMNLALSYILYPYPPDKLGFQIDALHVAFLLVRFRWGFTDCFKQFAWIGQFEIFDKLESYVVMYIVIGITTYSITQVFSKFFFVLETVYTVDSTDFTLENFQNH